MSTSLQPRSRLANNRQEGLNDNDKTCRSEAERRQEYYFLGWHQWHKRTNRLRMPPPRNVSDVDTWHPRLFVRRRNRISVCIDSIDSEGIMI